MRIGELGERADLSTKTIRYYEQIGVMAEPDRTPAGYRDYEDSALARLQFIRAAQAVGFSLGEIKEVLAFSDRGETPCLHVTTLMEERIRTLSAHIRDLQQMRRELERLVQRATTHPSAPPGAGGFCHLIGNARPQPQRVSNIKADEAAEHGDDRRPFPRPDHPRAHPG